MCYKLSTYEPFIYWMDSTINYCFPNPTRAIACIYKKSDPTRSTQIYKKKVKQKPDLPKPAKFARPNRPWITLSHRHWYSSKFIVFDIGVIGVVFIVTTSMLVYYNTQNPCSSLAHHRTVQCTMLVYGMCDRDSAHLLTRRKVKFWFQSNFFCFGV